MLVVIALALLLFVLPAPIGIGVVVLAFAGELAEVVFWRRFLRRYRIRSGVETMPGRVAVVSAECRPLGSVRFDGAIWRARCSEGAALGDEVTITEVDGLTLEVRSGSGD